jgi:hypothetical protein
MVTTGQKVGIGTAAPQASLQINTATPPNIGTPWDFYSYNPSYGRVGIDSGVNNAGLEFLESTVRKWFIGSFGGVFGVFNTPAQSFSLIIDATNNMGVGTFTPTQKLEVNGGMRLNTATTKPACNANSRGTFWFTNGGSGKDTVEVCATNTSGVLAWRTIY